MMILTSTTNNQIKGSVQFEAMTVAFCLVYNFIQFEYVYVKNLTSYEYCYFRSSIEVMYKDLLG